MLIPSGIPRDHGPTVLAALFPVYNNTSVVLIFFLIPGALVSLTLCTKSKSQVDEKLLPKLIVNVWPELNAPTSAFAVDLFFNETTLPFGYARLIVAAEVFTIPVMF